MKELTFFGGGAKMSEERLFKRVAYGIMLAFFLILFGACAEGGGWAVIIGLAIIAADIFMVIFVAATKKSAALNFYLTRALDVFLLVMASWAVYLFFTEYDWNILRWDSLLSAAIFLIWSLFTALCLKMILQGAFRDFCCIKEPQNEGERRRAHLAAEIMRIKKEAAQGKTVFVIDESKWD